MRSYLIGNYCYSRNGFINFVKRLINKIEITIYCLAIVQ